MNRVWRDGGRRNGRWEESEMHSVQHSPVVRNGIARSIFAGGLAGALGTATMDALLYSRYRRCGVPQGPLEWEFSSGVVRAEDVPGAGRVGKRVWEGVLGPDGPDRWARSSQNVGQWVTGMGWGAPFGAVVG